MEVIDERETINRPLRWKGKNINHQEQERAQDNAKLLSF
jgi:hypothetical protein